jgi:hypothetical protein
MRRLTLVAIASLAALAMLVVPASGRIDHHFAVDIKGSETQVRGERDSFRLRAPLVATFNHDNQVGRLQVHCNTTPRHKIKCAGIVHLNGDVGGEGFLYVRGNLSNNDSRLTVTGGTDDFDGAAGKIVAPKNRLHFHLVR